MWRCALLLTAALFMGSLGCGRSSNDGTAPTATPHTPVAVEGSQPAKVTDTHLMFVDRNTESTVPFIYRNGEEAGNVSILESLGGGVALLDFDGDGDLDLFVPGGGEFGNDFEIRGLQPGLFRNEGNFQFTDITQQAELVNGQYYSHGVAVADYDHDGFPDVLITGYGGLMLYRNTGDGTFQLFTSPAGLNDTGWSSSAAWGDLNGDGDLDLYVAHYVEWSLRDDVFCPGPKPGVREICPPKTYAPQADICYFSNGDGTFREVSDEIGLRKDGKGLGVLAGDFDNDGDLDLYVANDTTENFLYRNDGTGRFQDFSLLSATAVSDKGVAEGSMGVDLADFNLDGLADLWVTNYERESIGLYRNDGNCLFQYVSQPTGITAVDNLYVGWGTVFADFDRDGDEDVVVSNGHVLRYPENAPLRQKPLLFENDGGRRFRNVAAAAGEYFTAAHMGRGVAAGDIDNDGRIDLVISHINDPPALLENRSTDANNWISVRLTGVESNRSAIGSRIVIRTEFGSQTRQIKGGTSYASSHDPAAFFGIGTAETVNFVDVYWPSGRKQSFSDVPANQVIKVIEGGRVIAEGVR